MSNLNAAQIQGYAAAAGFSGAALATAVAIALAESSGNPAAVNPNDPGGSYGLWQINMAAHPEFAGLNLADPQTNANCAFQVYLQAGGSFTPWSTYGSGAYTAYLASVPAPTGSGAPNQGPSPFIAPTTSTLTIPPPALPPPASSSIWGPLAIGAALILGVGFVLSE